MALYRKKRPMGTDFSRGQSADPSVSYDIRKVESLLARAGRARVGWGRRGFSRACARGDRILGLGWHKSCIPFQSAIRAISSGFLREGRRVLASDSRRGSGDSRGPLAGQPFGPPPRQLAPLCRQPGPGDPGCGDPLLCRRVFDADVCPLRSSRSPIVQLGSLSSRTSSAASLWPTCDRWMPIPSGPRGQLPQQSHEAAQ